MPSPHRRHCLAGLAAATFALAAPAVRAQARKKLKMLLNTAYSGPQAWLLLAEERGLLAQEGVDVEFTTGAGAYTAAPRMADGGFDLGYGDINALIEVAAARPDAAPVGVFMMFNSSPSTVTVDAAGPIRAPKDLEGRTIGGHATDVALRTFGAFCKVAGVDRATIKTVHFDGSMRALVEAMLAGKGLDGAFGYVSTQTAALASAGIDPKQKLRFLKFADHVPDLYGSSLMASRRLMRDDPDAVRGVVRALNRGLVEVLRDHDAAIAAVAKKDANIRHDIEKLRLLTTLQVEMSNAEGRTLGIGEVDDARLARAIALIAETNALPRTPAIRDVFVRDFLPPAAERVTSLAA